MLLGRKQKGNRLIMKQTKGLTGEGRVARKGQHVVEEEVERQADARFPPVVEQNLGVEGHAPAARAEADRQQNASAPVVKELNSTHDFCSHVGLNLRQGAGGGVYVSSHRSDACVRSTRCLCESRKYLTALPPDATRKRWKRTREGNIAVCCRDRQTHATSWHLYRTTTTLRR